MDDPMTTLLVIAFAGGLIAGTIAGSKGNSFGVYFVLGALFPLIGVLVAAVSPGPGKLAQLTPAAEKGWHRDPTGRFEHRYFDGRRWTKAVGRGGERFEDPL